MNYFEKEHAPLFGTTEGVGFAYHNVGYGVLRGASHEVSEKVNAHYGTRAGHIPDKERVGVLVSQPNELIRQQMEYQSRIIGREIQVTQIGEMSPEPALVVPYINTPETEKEISDMGMEVWGLPATMVHQMKNKVSFHHLAHEAGIPGFSTPDYTVCTLQDLPRTARGILVNIEEGYANTGLRGKYPTGLMVRTEESDGNYGAAILKEDGDKVVVLPDGNAQDQITARDWNEALQISTRVLSSTVNQERANRVVVTRFMDLADSPGLSVVIKDGEVMSLGWNGQVREPGSSACVGTSSYQPKDKYLQRMQATHEDASVHAFEQFLRYVAQKSHIDFSTVNGICNTDLMIPGPLEREFQKRLGRNPTHITVAEINPRFTNYTDAMALVMWAESRQQSVAGMRETIAQGMLAVDKFPIPIADEASIPFIREELARLDEKLKKETGSRVILRMPDTPKFGVVFSGNIDIARSETIKMVSQITHGRTH